MIDALQRSVTLDVKAERVETLAKIDINDDEDLSITAPTQVAAYITSRRNQRDNLVAAAKPVVAAWTP